MRSLSVSQIAKFNPAEDGCELRWWYRYKAKKPEPSSANQQVGIEVHRQLEHTLRHGNDVLGKIAGAARHLLPPRGEGLLLEWGLHDKPRVDDEHFFPPEQSLVQAAGVGLIGFMDLVDPRPDHFLPDGTVVHEPGVVEVLDYKTTKNFKWSKPAAELVYTTQMPGYGVFAAKKFPWATHVRLSHLNLLTEGEPEAKKESVVVGVDVIVTRWDMAVRPLAEKMKVVETKERADDVEGNLAACGSFGGCPHRHYCVAVKPQNPLKRKFNMGLLKDRTAGSTPAAPAGSPPPNGAAAASTPWIPPAPPIVPRMPPPAPPRMTIQDELGSKGVAKGSTSGAIYEFTGGALGKFLSAVDIGGQVVYSFIQVIDGVAGGTPFKTGADEPTTLVAYAEAPAAPLPPAVPPPPIFTAQVPQVPQVPPVPLATRVQTPAVPVPPAPEAKKLGRPKKTVTAAAENSAAAPGLRLYLGCAPSSPYTTLDAYIAEVLGEMQTEFSVSDIRFPLTADHPLAYARWEGALAAAVRAGPPPAGDYVVHYGSKISEIVVETLIPFCAAGNVIRAF